VDRGLKNRKSRKASPEKIGHRRTRDSLGGEGNATIVSNYSKTIDRWADRWSIPKLRRHVAFRRNPRLRVTVARWVVASQCVELGPRFFKLRRHQQEILCHELAHAAALIKHGPCVSAHGREWRELVRAAGFEPKVRWLSPRENSTRPGGPRRPARLYEHRCPVCQAVRIARRAMTQWRCVECVDTGLAGRLEITVLSRLEVNR
jgi:predicted SprT family Zn-dependent metalloprotease